MDKKLLLVVTTNPTLSSKYASIANESPGIKAKALCPANGLSTLLLLLKGQFSDADSVLLSPDTLHVFDHTPEDAIRQIREAKPSIRILILKIGGLTKKSEPEQRMIAAGADGVYVGVDPSMNDFRHWITFEMNRPAGTRGRIHKGKLRQQSPYSAKPAAKPTLTIALGEDLDDFTEDDADILSEGQEAPETIPTVRRPYPAPDRRRKRPDGSGQSALSAIDEIRERRDGNSWLFKVPPQSPTRNK